MPYYCKLISNTPCPRMINHMKVSEQYVARIISALVKEFMTLMEGLKRKIKDVK